MKTVKEQLQAALKLFGPNGENWVPRCPETEAQHCAVTACSVISAYDKSTLWTLLEKQLPNKNVALATFNDAHTFPEVKALFERAIAAAE